MNTKEYHLKIETCLLKYDLIKDAVVVERKDENGKRYLCAYIVAGDNVTMHQLKEHMNGELPDYMIPTYFIKLEGIPLTASGKVNRRALPMPDSSIKCVLN